MGWMIIGGIVLLLGIIGGFVLSERTARIGAVVFGVIVFVIGLVLGSFYTQDIGEAKVLKNFDGRIIGQDIDPGVAYKAPWVDAIDFDIRNQQAIYKGAGTGEGENGAEITIQDKDKVTANVDIAIRYSILPEKVTDIYTEYQSQANFTARLVDQDMKSVVRNTFSSYTTAQVLESRADIELKISEALKARWEGQGVTVESVALQDIRYPEATQNGFTSAQESVTNLKKAEAELKVAQAQAKSNKVISDSLTPELLQKEYNETLKEIGKHGNLIVTEGGQNVMLNVDRNTEK